MAGNNDTMLQLLAAKPEVVKKCYDTHKKEYGAKACNVITHSLVEADMDIGGIFQGKGKGAPNTDAVKASLNVSIENIGNCPKVMDCILSSK